MTIMTTTTTLSEDRIRALIIAREIHNLPKFKQYARMAELRQEDPAFTELVRERLLLLRD